MKYLYQVDNKLRYIYYITPKCGSRTFFDLFNYKMVKFRKITPKHNDYFSWSFVRNPWDRLLSTYTNKIINKHSNIGDDLTESKSFKDFILKIEKIDTANAERHIRSLHTFLPKDIDFIGKLENFQKDFNKVCDKIGIPRQKLSHKNKTDHKPYAECYDDEMREIVEQKYAEDIERFGYKFEE